MERTFISESIAAAELVKPICVMLQSSDTQELSVSGEVRRSVMDTTGMPTDWQKPAAARVQGL